MLTWPQINWISIAMLVVFAALQVAALRHLRRDVVWHLLLLPMLLVGAAFGCTSILAYLGTGLWALPVFYVTPFATVLLVLLWAGGSLCDCCRSLCRASP